MKFASLLVAAVVLVSCGGDNGGGSLSGVLKIEPDKTLIQSDGVDHATLIVTLDGEVLTSGVDFYVGTSKIDVQDFKFFATEAGDYQVWASHGTYISDPVTIRAISVPIPETPEDPTPSGTDFKSRVMCMQFTGTACGYCSEFMSRLKEAFEDEDFSDEYVRVAIHNYQYSDSYPDAAYLAWEWGSNTLGATNPSIIMDYKIKYVLYQATTSSSEFKGVVREQNASKEDAACGIAVNARLADNQVVARVTVKAAQTGSYRVGAMLLEDGIYGKQINGESWMNTHDACVRHIDAMYKVNAKEMYYGHSLGHIEAGKTADYLFIWNLDEIQRANDPNFYWDDFVEENLRMAVFVTEAKDDAYYINNAVQARFNEELQFEYR